MKRMILSIALVVGFTHSALGAGVALQYCEHFDEKKPFGVHKVNCISYEKYEDLCGRVDGITNAADKSVPLFFKYNDWKASSSQKYSPRWKTVKSYGFKDLCYLAVKISGLDPNTADSFEETQERPITSFVVVEGEVLILQIRAR